MKKIIIVVSIILSLVTACKSQSCKDLPESFNSYTEAIDAIKDAQFKLTDKLPNGKSSWIIKADYYSCDTKVGYMVYTTAKGREYIHEAVPKSVWLEFKNATSSGSYYDYNIKHKYRLVPE